MKTLRIKQVQAMTGLSRSTIYLYMGQGIFPMSFKIGLRAVGWLEEEVLGWIDQKRLNRGP
jgi:prophage regulatory protein